MIGVKISNNNMVYSWVLINIITEKRALEGVGEEHYKTWKEIVRVLRISHSIMNYLLLVVYNVSVFQYR